MALSQIVVISETVPPIFNKFLILANPFHYRFYECLGFTKSVYMGWLIMDNDRFKKITNYISGLSQDLAISSASISLTPYEIVKNKLITI